MIVTACLTNCCGKVKPLNEVYGIIHVPDIFNEEESFKTVDAHKTQIHFCVECYTKDVVDKANSLCYRRNNEDKYQQKLKELTYLFKRFIHSRAQIEQIKNNFEG